MRRRRSEPEPPEGLRIHFLDGRIVPVECVYCGIIGGFHHWRVVYPMYTGPEGLEGIELRADAVPAMTSIGFELIAPIPEQDDT